MLSRLRRHFCEKKFLATEGVSGGMLLARRVLRGLRWHTFSKENFA
jgi:hypothetical protein